MEERTKKQRDFLIEAVDVYIDQMTEHEDPDVTASATREERIRDFAQYLQIVLDAERPNELFSQ